MVVAVVDADGTERDPPHSVRRAPAVDDGDKVKRGQRIAEWDPYTRRSSPKSAASSVRGPGRGRCRCRKRSTRPPASPSASSSTGALARGGDLRPAMVIKGKDGKILKLARGGDPLHAAGRRDPLGRAGGQGQAGDVIARISTESAKTRDITGGLPRVAELFEARKPKDARSSPKSPARSEFGRDYKNKRRISIEPMDKNEESRSST
jgi:DNA-directed RNA polymerase subunit beta'